MPTKVQAQHCSRCGTRLARDNGGVMCGSCAHSMRDALLRPPRVSPTFWQTDQMRDALATRHMGRVIRAYRTHPYHGGGLRQETVSRWLGITQAQLSRMENGRAPDELSKLIRYAQTLAIPADMLWFRLPDEPESSVDGPDPLLSRRNAAVRLASGRRLEIDDMERRELLQRLSVVGALMAVPVGVGAGRADSAAVVADGDDGALWQAFRRAPNKVAVFPEVCERLRGLTGAADRVRDPGVRARVCAAIGDVGQLAGEVFFDAERFDDAVHCYTVAATASREAGRRDQWACALTRHAYVCLAQGRPRAALRLLDAAADVARDGDTALGTRHWISSVQAQALARVGDTDGCLRAFGAAEDVRGLGDPVGRTGWLRFDGSRLAEERGTCLVALGRPEQAESALAEALSDGPSGRRRGAVLADFATVGVLRRDPDHLAVSAYAALDVLRQTGSGYLAGKLRGLRVAMRPHRADARVRSVDDAVAAALV